MRLRIFLVIRFMLIWLDFFVLDRCCMVVIIVRNCSVFGMFLNWW